MSLGMMLYKPPRHLTRTTRQLDPQESKKQLRAASPSSVQSAVDPRSSSDSRTGSRSDPGFDQTSGESYIDNDFFSQGSNISADGNYVISQTRSIALPFVFALVVIGLIISFIAPSVARADRPRTDVLNADFSNASGVVLEFCQGRDITIDAQDSQRAASVDEGSGVAVSTIRVLNNSSAIQQVVCPIDMLPVATISHATLSLTHPDISARSPGSNGSIHTARSRCALMSRHSMGGQARGVAVSARAAGDNVLTLPATQAGIDEFRYIECFLAPGAAITNVDVAGTQKEIKAASHADTRSDWTLLSSQADAKLLKLPSQ